MGRFLCNTKSWILRGLTKVFEGGDPSSATCFSQCFRTTCCGLEFTQLLVGDIPETLICKTNKSDGRGV